MSDRESYLFVVSGAFSSQIGGHLLSAITLARYIAENHCSKVGIVVDTEILPESASRAVKHYRGVYRNSLRGHLLRAADVHRIVGKDRYKAIVAMDAHAGRDCLPAAIFYATPLLQVRAGGPPGLLPPLRLPGHIVFSRELYDGLQAIHKVPASHLVYTPARVAVNSVLEDPCSQEDTLPLGFAPGRMRLLAISRLTDLKSEAIRQLIRQAVRASEAFLIDMKIVGDGDARRSLSDYANEQMQSSESKQNLQVEFLGSFRVRPTHLVQADLVIGQGRTVLEALASGVPASVCGNGGYCGLIDSLNREEIAYSNFSGRGIPANGNLLDDLKLLNTYREEELCNIRSWVRETYDAKHGADAVKMASLMIRESYPCSSRLRSRLAIAALFHLGRALFLLLSARIIRRLRTIHLRRTSQ